MTNTTRRLLPVALSLLALAGCDQQSASSKALEDAADAMQTLTAESVVVDTEVDRRVYRQVLRLLAIADREGTSEEKAVAALLTARCNAGLAKDPSGLAEKLEARASTITANIATLHESWLRSDAEASAGYDPRDDIAQIREQIAEKDQEIADLSQRKAEVDRHISELRELANSKLGSAATERAAAGDLELRASRLGATEGLPLTEESHARSRQADTLERDALSLDAQADQIAPVSAEYALDVSRLEAQRGLLESEGQAAQARADRGSAESADARAAADATASNLDEAIDSLAALRSGELSTAYGEAIRLYESAAQTARRGSGAGRLQAGAIQGRVLQELAALRRSRAARLAGNAQLLRSLDALPNASHYAALADDYASAADAERQSASEAEEVARSAFESAGLVEQPEEEFAYPDSPSSDHASPERPDPWSLVDSLVEAANAQDFTAGFGLMHADDANGAALLDVMRQVGDAFVRFDAAFSAQFGRKFADLAEEMQQAAGVEPKRVTRDDFMVRDEGDTVYIANPDGNELSAVLIDGQWKLVLNDAVLSNWLKGAPVSPDSIVSLAQRYAPDLAAAIDTVTAQIENGTYAGEQVALQAFQMSLGSVIQQMMQDPDAKELVTLIQQQMSPPEPPGGP